LYQALKLRFDCGGNIDPPDLQKRSHRCGLLNGVSVYREDLPIEVPFDPARFDLRPPRRWLIFNGVKVCGSSQHVVMFEFIHGKVFRAAP
jgi:hypothetical protein